MRVYVTGGGRGFIGLQLNTGKCEFKNIKLKPLGLSPPGIEFKRAHLYDVNPVGVGAMLLASALSITAYLGY